MTQRQPEYRQLQGKTYSLFGNQNETDSYYDLIAGLIDLCLKKYGDDREVLKIFRYITRQKNPKNTRWNGKFSPEALSLKNLLTGELSNFTRNTGRHLENLGFFAKFSHTLSTSEWQYHVYMLEIELTNRMNRNEFLKADFKLALLPHCLRDLKKECKSTNKGIEYSCNKCSADCYIRHATGVLAENHVDAFIWKSANLKSLLRKLHSKYTSVGVLGIACIPELVNGMRLCSGGNVPVVGLPLDANRCIRWMGAFHPNSINLKRLERLVSEKQASL
jgi:hypothetical protein